MELIIQIIAGLIGGNAAGAGMKNTSLGTAGNSVVGGVGGLLGGLLTSTNSGVCAGCSNRSTIRPSSPTARLSARCCRSWTLPCSRNWLC